VVKLSTPTKPHQIYFKKNTILPHLSNILVINKNKKGVKMTKIITSYYPTINVEIFLDEHQDGNYQERLKFGDYSLDDFLMEEDFTQSLKDKIKEFIIEKLKNNKNKSLINWSEF
jgi:hypothetical protein